MPKVLVANRGEIALRILRACRLAGMETVAVYSQADKKSLHVAYADESYLIGPPAAQESYLNMDKILEVACKTDSKYIHPGYGFLAEKPEFAKSCEAAGIKFIGPSSDCIERVGNKIFAKEEMGKVGIPVLPGMRYEGDIDVAGSFAREIGYPLIVKLAQGGGGIGHNVAWNEEQLYEAITKTQRAGKFFSNVDDSESEPEKVAVLIEKYLEAPRHIEFQILADSRGNIIHVGDRECSIQRRHQKLIEESPSPIMTPELRENMGSHAVLAAKVVKYTNAGTAEFLYDQKTGKHYFLEMNARLQVEHPITEVVNRVDLVLEQLNIALGNSLTYKQSDIVPIGHAIECRITAEDPLNNFMPSPGKLRRYRSPGGYAIRVDSGVHAGYTIPKEYDSLISKITSWGPTRLIAIERMLAALEEYVIAGVPTTIPFHETVLKNKRFRDGYDLNTHFIDDERILEQIVPIGHERRKRLESAMKNEEQIVAAITTAINTHIQDGVNKGAYRVK